MHEDFFVDDPTCAGMKPTTDQGLTEKCTYIYSGQCTSEIAISFWILGQLLVFC